MRVGSTPNPRHPIPRLKGLIGHKQLLCRSILYYLTRVFDCGQGYVDPICLYVSCDREDRALSIVRSQREDNTLLRLLWMDGQQHRFNLLERVKRKKPKVCALYLVMYIQTKNAHRTFDIVT